MSRALSLTPQIAAQLVAAVRTGACLVDAARSVGLAPSTAYDWLTRGAKRPRSEFGELRRAVLAARTHATRVRRAAVARATRSEIAKSRRRAIRVVVRVPTTSGHPADA